MTNSQTHSSDRPVFPSLLRVAALVTLTIGLLFSLGCANGEIRLGDPFDRQMSFEEAQHRYTVLTRWKKYQESKNFVAREDRADYLKRMKAFKESRFTEFEVEEAELDQELETATMTVAYTIYTASMPYATKLIETQIWSRDGISNNWYVDSSFDATGDVAAN